MVEVANGGDNSIDSKNINLDKCAIHIHGGMEHNLAKHAKYYYCGHIKILGSSQFIRETDHSKRDFFGHW
jgi:hypothetical protein